VYLCFHILHLRPAGRPPKLPAFLIGTNFLVHISFLLLSFQNCFQGFRAHRALSLRKTAFVRLHQEMGYARRSLNCEDIGLVIQVSPPKLQVICIALAYIVNTLNNEARQKKVLNDSEMIVK